MEVGGEFVIDGEEIGHGVGEPDGPFGDAFGDAAGDAGERQGDAFGADAAGGMMSGVGALAP